MPHLLQINYKFSVARAEFEKGFDALASQIAQVPGLRWKIWLLNEAESRGGGIYLFDDEESARAYLEGPIIAAMKSLPVVSELSVHIVFRVGGAHGGDSRTNRGDLGTQVGNWLRRANRPTPTDVRVHEDASNQAAGPTGTIWVGLMSSWVI